MRSTSLFYRRLASPLHAARASVGVAWVLSITTAAVLLYHPLVLVPVFAAVLVAGAGAGVGRTLLRALRFAAIVWVPIVLVNVVVSRDGLTVFARLGDLGPFGQGNLTVEAVVYGAVIALKVMLVVLVTTLASLAVDPDETLRLVRRVSFRSALTASLATRLIPVLAADAQRLAEAQRTRPGGARGGTRGRVALVRAVVAGSLDRAADVAATLEVRGFASASRPPRRRPPLSRHDLAFAVSAVAVLALAILARVSGAARFDAYPEIHAAFGLGTFAIAAALFAAIVLPFADRRGIEP